MFSHFLNNIYYIVPEANPIIKNFNLQDLNSLKSLYTLDENIQPKVAQQQPQEKIQLLGPELIQYEIQDERTLEEIFTANKIIYDKYEKIQKNFLSDSLILGDFNEIYCSLQKLSSLRKDILQCGQIDSKTYQTSQVSQDYLTFDSEFESGNLAKVAVRAQDDYILLLQNDLNSRGHTQWFYFRVRNHQKLGRVKFEIINLSKNGFLYQKGMKISVFTRNQWQRGGCEIQYFRNGIQKFPEEENQESWYSLSWVWEFTQPNEEIYFAQSQPYCVSDLNEYLNKAKADPFKSRYLNRSLLCRSLCGNRIEKITVTDPENPEHPKLGIVIMGRVHPGETVSSFVVQGIIEWLLSEDQKANELRKNFVVKIIPMLNPDGVIHGNYRCSLAGCDLNRRWKNPIRELHPEIYFAKNMIISFHKTTKIVLLIDCHGHNLKRSVFMYGCSFKKQIQKKDNTLDLYFESQRYQTICKEFPFILSQMDKNFSFKNCSYHISKNKNSTARITLWNELKFPHVYTLEASFCGPDNQNIHFLPSDLHRLGKHVCESAYKYFLETKQYEIHQIAQKNAEIDRIKKLWINLYEESKMQNKIINNNDDDDQTIGSESEPSEDNFNIDKQNRFLPKNLRRKKKIQKQIPQEKLVSVPPQVPEIEKKIIQRIKIKPAYSLQQQFYSRNVSKRKDSKGSAEVVRIPIKVYDINWSVGEVEEVFKKYDLEQIQGQQLQYIKLQANDNDFLALKNIQNSPQQSGSNEAHNNYNGLHKRAQVNAVDKLVSTMRFTENKSDIVHENSLIEGQHAMTMRIINNCQIKDALQFPKLPRHQIMKARLSELGNRSLQLE